MERTLKDLEPFGWVAILLVDGCRVSASANTWETLRVQIRLAEHEGRPLWWSGTDRYGDEIELRTDYICGVMKNTPEALERSVIVNQAENTATGCIDEGPPWEE